MVGKTISHYEILEKLGEVGMGVVYKARDTNLDRFVAIKVLPPERVADPERKRRFVQEAKAASALNHPNIVHIYDIDQQDGVDYIAMEHVQGKTLDELIGRKGLKLGDALKYGVQMADALSRAHAAGIIHRDLKPGNIVVDEHGLVKVLDFGLAKLTEAAPLGDDESTRTLKPTTEEGTIVGTVAYMSPEQAQGKRLDARSDMFSLGAVFYEMVTGKRAFQKESKASTLGAIIHKDPDSLGGIVPHDLERVLSRCLHKDPGRRFQHMDDLRVALEELKEESDSGAPKEFRETPGQLARVRRSWKVAAMVGALLIAVSITVVVTPNLISPPVDAVTIETTTPQTEGPEVTAAREAIAKLYARLDSACERGDLDVLLSLALPDALVGNVIQRMPFTAAIAELKKAITAGVKFTSKSEITALSLYGSEATVTIRQSITTTRDGRTQSAEVTTIDKWVSKDSGWKLKESIGSSAELIESPTDAETSKQVAAELRRRVVPLTTAEAGNPYEDLVAFGKAVGDARVVALGEATHGTREIFQMKHRLLEYLVKEKGFTVFAIEANWPESIAVDRYIKTGEGDPRMALAGMYFWTWKTEEVLAMVEWMRAYNQTAGSRPQVSFTSFDMQTYTVALERVADYIKKNAPSDSSVMEASYWALRELASSRQRNDPRFTDASAQAEGVVRLLETRRERLTQASGGAAFSEALQAARIVAQAAKLRSPGVGSDYRDQMMAANINWLAKEAFPNEKIVLWAHNGHVRTDGPILSRPMGNWVREAFGDGLYVLGFAIHKGEVRAVTLESGRMSGVGTSSVPAAPSGTGTAVLSAAGLPIFFADLKSLAAGGGVLGSWLGQPHLFRECGAGWSRDGAANANMASTALSSSYDGLIFLEDTHAARGLQ